MMTGCAEHTVHAAGQVAAGNVRVGVAEEKTMNQSSLDGTAALRLAFVQARWHADIVDQCRESFLAQMRLLSGPATMRFQ